MSVYLALSAVLMLWGLVFFGEDMPSAIWRLALLPVVASLMFSLKAAVWAMSFGKKDIYFEIESIQDEP